VPLKEARKGDKTKSKTKKREKKKINSRKKWIKQKRRQHKK
jgi:hypothetical protein